MNKTILAYMKKIGSKGGKKKKNYKPEELAKRTERLKKYSRHNK